MLRGLVSTIKTLFVLTAASVTATVTSASVNLKEYRNFAFLVLAGDFTFTGVNKVGLQILESDDDITFAPAPAEAYLGGAMKELDDVADKNSIHNVEYKGHKQYVKISLVVGGVVAAPMSVTGPNC